LREAGDNPVAAEIAAQFRHRSEQGRCIGRPDHRSVDHPLDPGPADGGHARIGAQHVRLDPLEVVGEQSVPEADGRLVFGPELHRALVGADKQPEPLLAQRVFAVAVGDRRQAAPRPGDLGERLGDEILVLGRDQRQVDTRHPSHLARP
jgi:hypothetical protein